MRFYCYNLVTQNQSINPTVKTTCWGGDSGASLKMMSCQKRLIVYFNIVYFVETENLLLKVL